MVQMCCYPLHSSICHHSHLSMHPSFVSPCVLRYVPTHQYNQLIKLLNQLIILWLWPLGCPPSSVVDVALLCYLHLHLYHYHPRLLFVIDLLSVVIPSRPTSILLNFAPQIEINLFGFNLLIFTDMGLGSMLVNITSNTILLGNTYFTLYNPNHFLVNFPRCDLLPFGNHRTKSPHMNFFCYSSTPQSSIPPLCS